MLAQQLAVEPFDLAVAKGVDCKVTVNVLVLPGEKRTLLFRSGWGSADLSATLSNPIRRRDYDDTHGIRQPLTPAEGGPSLAFRRSISASPG